MTTPVISAAAVIALVLALAQPAFSQQLTAGADSASVLVRLVTEGRYAEARRELRRQVAGKPDAALHIAHLEGVIKAREGDLASATKIFRAILAAEPNFLPSRVELARTLLRAGDAEASTYHFEAIARGSGDPALQRFATRYLENIDSARTHGFSFYLSALPSTNVNKGTGNRTFEAGGLVFTIDEESRQASGVGAATGGAAFKTFRLRKDIALTASGTADLKKYQNTTRYDELALGANLALSRRMGRVTAAIGPTFEYRWAGWDPYLVRYGATVGAKAQVGQRNTVGLSFTALAQDYVDLDYRDGSRFAGSLIWRRLLSPSVSVSAKVGVDAERTQRRHLDHNDLVLRLQVDKEWRGGLMTSLFGSYENHHYLGAFPGTDHRRQDDKFSIGTSFSHRRFSIGGFAPQITYQYSKQRSNISFYDYESHDLGLNLTRKF
ncbi:surface lipoprotein assembly modifier [Chelativorans salis]|uniref:Surface lipoprotein assembly modifier n=1 Tax=Chelativorans salis TaxID=2978478 RepID=A0ABT2LN04_9HYPH|nr:surface lipoprotein assembly modifier [Chelativorans sp. EGI FJ00035]MCT7375812.1 surface lipoprotein assembly modifier [Chelativorans sp. EGI FJ00035]